MESSCFVAKNVFGITLGHLTTHQKGENCNLWICHLKIVRHAHPDRVHWLQTISMQKGAIRGPFWTPDKISGSPNQWRSQTSNFWSFVTEINFDLYLTIDSSGIINSHDLGSSRLVVTDKDMSSGLESWNLSVDIFLMGPFELSKDHFLILSFSTLLIAFGQSCLTCHLQFLFRKLRLLPFPYHVIKICLELLKRFRKVTIRSWNCVRPFQSRLQQNISWVTIKWENKYVYDVRLCVITNDKR